MTALANRTTSPIPERFRNVVVWDFTLRIWLHVGHPLTETRYAMLDTNGQFVTAFTAAEIEGRLERSAELAGHIVGPDTQHARERFSDVRVFDFQIGEWLHVGDVQYNTPAGTLYEMIMDDNFTVNFLFADDVESLIEKSSELAGLAIG